MTYIADSTTELPAQKVVTTTDACEVRLEITFSVSPAAWGVPADQIRNEVANRVEAMLSEQLRSRGLINRMGTTLL